MSFTLDRDRGASAGGVSAMLLVLLLFTFVVALVRPWGDYPVNDDWKHARVAQRLAAGKGLHFDVPVAPSLVGQVVFVWPIIRLFGFSHTLLRVTTLLLSVVVLFVLDRLMTLAGAGTRVRFVGLATVALNPMFLNLSASFMTEIYACVPTLIGAWIWFLDRRRGERVATPPGQPPPWIVRGWVAVLVGTLCGLSFWIRQFAVLALPALWIASFCPIRRASTWKSFRSSAGPVLASLIPAVAVVGAYFIWAKAADAFPSELAAPIARLSQFDPTVILAESGGFLTFLAGSCLPLLLLSWRGRVTNGGLLCGALLCVSCAVAGLVYQSMLTAQPGRFSEYPLVLAMGHHSSFPFIGNIFSESGIGPVTLSDVYQLGLPGRPRWEAHLWGVITTFALLANVLWVVPVRRLADGLRQAARPAWISEMAVFGLAWSVLSFVAALQSYQAMMFDRYYFSALLGTPLALVVLMSHGVSSSVEIDPDNARTIWQRGGAALAASIVLLGLATITVSGVHNYFRWNDARWALYRRALGRGNAIQTIEAGYEIQGWEAFDLSREPIDPERCLGPCRCTLGWYCIDDSYRVSMNALPGYRSVDAIQPIYWLASGPPVMMLQRAR